MEGSVGAIVHDGGVVHGAGVGLGETVSLLEGGESGGEVVANEHIEGVEHMVRIAECFRVY